MIIADWVLYTYLIGFVVGMIVSYLEFIVYKIKISTGDYIAIVLWNLVGWYIFIPWSVGDYLIKQWRKYV